MMSTIANFQTNAGSMGFNREDNQMQYRATMAVNNSNYDPEEEIRINYTPVKAKINKYVNNNNGGANNMGNMAYNTPGSSE